MSWPTLALAEACEINVGRTPSRSRSDYWGDGAAWLSIADMNQGRLISRTKETITPLAVREAAARPVEPGTVLLSFKLSIGKVGIAHTRMYTNEAIAALPVRSGVALDPEYLAWALGAMNLADGSNRAAMGPTLNKASLAQIPLLLPPIEEQRRIAAILDQADALRAKRREALALLDNLTQSIFFDMFGDPVANPKGWPIHLLGEHLQAIDSGRSPVCLSRPAVTDEWAVLKLGAVTYGVFDPTANKALPPTEIPNTTHEVHTGDLLFSRKNTRELVGAVALIGLTPRRLLLPDLIFRLKLTEESELDKAYLRALLMWPSKRSQVRDLSSGSAASMPNISKARLQSLKVEVPPAELQKAFARLMDSIEKQRQRQLASLEQQDVLFRALQARAFSGRL